MSQEALLESFGDFAARVVRKLQRSLSSKVDYEDLHSYGILGLLEAHERFDPDGSTAFETFAYYRVRGAVLDGCRKEGWLNRERQKTADKARSVDALMEDVGSERESVGSAKSFTDAVNKVTEVVTTAATVMLMHDANWDEYLGQQEPTQHRRIEKRESQILLKEAMKELTDEERDVIIRFDFKNERMQDIADDLGFSKAWVSRVRTRALHRMRAFIEHRE